MNSSSIFNESFQREELHIKSEEISLKSYPSEEDLQDSQFHEVKSEAGSVQSFSSDKHQFFDYEQDVDMDYDPLNVKDEEDFDRTKWILENAGDDHCHDSDASYKPSDDELLDDDDRFDDIKPVKGFMVKKNNQYTCSICGKKSKTSRSHIDHLRLKHPTHPFVKRQLNVDKIKLIESKEEMLNLGVPMRRMECIICNRKGFKGFVNYNDHLNGHRNIRSYVCACGSAFTTRHNFVSHKKRNCPQVALEDCQIPIYAKDSFSWLKQEMETEPSTRNRACTVCHKTGFHNVINLLDHEKSHTEEKPYKCGCGGNFSFLKEMTEHLHSLNCDLNETIWPDYAESYKVNHIKKTNIKSKIVLKKVKREPKQTFIIDKNELFDDVQYKKVKVQPDPEQTPWIIEKKKPKAPKKLIVKPDKKTILMDNCIILTNRGKVRNNRNFPIPTRILKDGKKLYTCWECDFCAPKTTLVYNHYENRHLVRKFKCIGCEKFFPSEVKLKRHMTQIHDDLVKCEYCEEAFPRIRIKRHTELKHLRPYSCDLCDASFGYSTSLVNHKLKIHQQVSQEPYYVSCLWCEHQIDIKNNSFQNHIATKAHAVYLKRWFEYNNIESISCHLCEGWKSDNIDVVMKHLNIQHRMGSERCIEYLSTLGPQDPDFLKTIEKSKRIRARSKKVKPEVDNSYSMIESSFISEEDKSYSMIDDTVKNEAPKTVTCFVCFKLIPLVNESPDKCLIRHVSPTTTNHSIYDEDFRMIHNLEFFPCSHCDFKSSLTLESALLHVKKIHDSSLFEYFEYLRCEFAPKINKSNCFICSKEVDNMEEHMRTQVHRLLEKRWTRIEKLCNFPCSICGSLHSSPFEGATHALELHNQPFVEYMQYIQIYFWKSKTVQNSDDEVTFKVKYDTELEAAFKEEEFKEEDYVVPYNYFLTHSF